MDGRQAHTVDEAQKDLVDAIFACPQCGERDVDQLGLDSDTEQVRCFTCGKEYSIKLDDLTVLPLAEACPTCGNRSMDSVDGEPAGGEDDPGTIYRCNVCNTVYYFDGEERSVVEESKCHGCQLAKHCAGFLEKHGDCPLWVREHHPEVARTL